MTNPINKWNGCKCKEWLITGLKCVKCGIHFTDQMKLMHKKLEDTEYMLDAAANRLKTYPVRCPNLNCDGNGSLWLGDRVDSEGNEYPEIHQCQWCKGRDESRTAAEVRLEAAEDKLMAISQSIESILESA